MATARSRGFYDLTTVMTETYDTEVGNAHTSLQGGYEWFCETLQLILAHAMETFDSEFYGAVDSATSPYQNSDFERLMLLATLWRIYKDLWARIKLLGWRAVELSDPDARTCYRPPNLDEFMLHQVGSYRNVQLTSEFQAQLITQVLPDTASDNPELIDKIAVSINVPMFGEAWDGQIDLPSMILAT